MLQKMLVLILVLTIPIVSLAQGWETIFGEEGFSNRGHAINQTSDGGYIVAGQGYCVSSNSTCYPFSLKLDENGQQEWTRLYDDGDNGYANDILETTNGNFMICGKTHFEAETWKAYITKTNTLGEEIWTNVVSDSVRSDGLDLFQTQDGNFMMIGDIEYDSVAILMIKFDSDGNELWRKTHKDGWRLRAESAIEASNGDILVQANIQIDQTTLQSLYLGRYDQNGEKVWSVILDDESLLFGDIIELENEEIVVAGRWTNGDIGVVKLEKDGDEVWQEVISRSMYGDLPWPELCNTSDGNIMVVTTVGLLYMLKMDLDGNILWEKKVGEFSDTIPYSRMPWDLQNTDDNGYIMTGWLNSNEDPAAYVLKVDDNGNVVNTIELKDNQKDVFNIYPNPTHEIFIVESTSNIQDGEIIIYNAMGKKVYQSKLISGISSHSLTDFPRGMYFYSITHRGVAIQQGKLMVK
jgi:Secretion system C-terminal sorting domain